MLIESSKALRLLQLLYGSFGEGYFTIWVKHEDGRKITHWYDLAVGNEALAQAAETALSLDAQGYDVYVSTCPAREQGTASTRINQGAVCAIPAFFMDLDIGKKDCPESKNELLPKLLALSVPPRMIIDSGSGFHAYWPLAEPIHIADKASLGTAKKKLRGFANCIAAKLGYTGFDLSASEPARVLRIPGTHNRKEAAARPVDVMHNAALPPYTLDALQPLFKDRQAKGTTPPKTQDIALPDKPSMRNCVALTDQEILAKAKKGKHGERFSRLFAGEWQTDYPSQSEADIALCNTLAFYTQGDATQIDALFKQSGLYRPDKWDQMHGATTYGEATICKALDTTTIYYSKEHNTIKDPAASGQAFDRYAQAYALVGGYVAEKGKLQAESIDKNGEITAKPLSNFAALITDETTLDDGVDTRKEFILDGITSSGKALPVATVPTHKFGSMTWVLDAWGVDANIYPGQTIRDKVRYAIQAASMPLLRRNTVYTHTGFRRINGKTAYLYHGGAVGLGGVSVELDGLLSMYSLPDSAGDVKTAAAASMEMLTVLPPRIAYPLLAHMYLAPLCSLLEEAGSAPAYVLYLSGRSGTRKTTAAALALSHFGAGFHSNRLPSSFNDTANATQQKAFELKDMPLLVDDFCPSTNMLEQRRRSGIAQQLIRAWGDHAERGRMRSDTTLQKSKPPRGLGMMTGEDVPAVGESGVARLYLVDVKPGEIQPNDSLTALQRKAREGLLSRAMRGYIEWLLPQYDTLPKSLVAQFTAYREMAQARLQGAHGRQPEAIAWMLVGIDMMLQYWAHAGILDDLHSLQAQAQDVLFAHSAAQQQAIREEEPVRMFLQALDELCASGEGRIMKLGSATTIQAPCAGLLGYEDAEYRYLIPGLSFAAVQKHFTTQGTAFPISRNVIWKRMVDQGIAESWGTESSHVKHIPGLGSKRVVYIKQSALAAHSNTAQEGEFEI